jgi:general secretion pathway protein E
MGDFLGTLRQRRLINDEQVQRLGQSGADEKPVRAILRFGFIDQQVLASELARHFALSPVGDDEWPKERLLPEAISLRFMREHHVLPLRSDHARLTVAVSDPTDHAVLNALKVAGGRDLELKIATDSQIVSRIERLANGASAVETRVGLATIKEEEEQLKDLALDAPVIDLVNRLFREASAARATDLHIEPARGRVAVRRRVDGLLQDAGTLPVDLGRAAVSRVKILTRLNIAERRLPQDGRARIRAGERDYDIRVATMPTVHGESIAIRFLSESAIVPELDRLGLAPRDVAVVRKQASHAHGLIVVTGPTGSGKTTTLAAILNFLNDPSRKILTIEDPVEYQVEGVNQIQVQPEIGLTFAQTLRSLLRHDPDIIMVGEMRDAETAKIGVNAALTGHLVLTTLHTNSAASAVTRLLDLDVQSYLIASTLRCVVAQRLVRRLCGNCREPYQESPAALAGLAVARSTSGPIELWRARGCDHCGGTGFIGRTAVFELLEIDERMRGLIRPEVSADVIEAAARAAGMANMLADGLAKCRAGVTTIEELGRVTSD